MYTHNILYIFIYLPLSLYIYIPLDSNESTKTLGSGQVRHMLLRPSLARSVARRGAQLARLWLSHEAGPMVSVNSDKFSDLPKEGARTLLGAPGRTTRSKDATRSKGHRY